MAKKSLTTDDFSLDSDLDFDFGTELNTDMDQSSSKSRSPVMSVAVGAVGGVGDALASPSFYKSFLSRAMPKHYGDIASGLGESVSEISELYDQTRNEVKPRLNRIANQLDRMTPESSKSLKSMVKKLVDWTDDGQGSISATNEADQADAAVTSMLGSIFQAQVQKDKIDETRQIMRDAIENKREQRSYSVSAQMSQDISTIQQYTTTVTQGYQKKSLELQLRSYLAQRSYFAKSLRLLEANQEQNKAIIKNTALSEASKITEMERVKSNAKERLIDSLYGDGSIIKRTARGLKETIGGYVEGFGRRMDIADMQLDMANFSVEMIRDLNASLVEMGQQPITKEQLAGAMIGNVAVDEATQRAMPYIRKFFEDKKGTKDFLAKGARVFLNPGAKIKEAIDSDRMKEGLEAPGLKGQFYKFGNLLLSNMLERESDQSFDVGLRENEENQGQGFTKKAHVSLVSVIPGFLARIHQELAWTRTKSKTAPGLLTYNFSNDKFETVTTKVKRDLTDFNNALSQNSFASKARDAVGTLAGEEEIEDKDREALTAFIARLSRQNNFKFEDLESIKELDDYKNLDPDTQVLFNRLFDAMERDEFAEGRLTDFVKSMRSVKDETPSQYKAIERMIKEGHGSLLAKEGLVTSNTTGSSFQVDNDKVFELTLEKLGLKPGSPASSGTPGVTFTSDMNAKEDIKETSPTQLLKTLGKRAYDGMKKTRIFDWKYKKGIGEDQEPHSGPMAQDVQRNLGDAAAPGGTSIDPQTITGSFFAAIQHLGNKVESLFKKKGVDVDEDDVVTGKQPKNYLKSIDTRLSKIQMLLNDRLKAGTAVASEPSSGKKLGDVATGALEGGLARVGKAADWVGGKIEAGADSIADLWSKNKDKLKDAASGLFNSASSLATSLFDQTKKFTTKILPEWFGKAKDFGKKVWKGISDEFQTWKDVYVPGREEPALRAVLLKAGEYRDAVTGKVIESMNELSEAKGDILDKLGNVVISARELSGGIYDSTGEKIKATSQVVAGKIAGAARWVGSKLIEGAGKIRDLLSDGIDKGKEWWSDSPEFKFPEFGGGGAVAKRQLAELVNIRDILLGKQKQVRKRIKDEGSKEESSSVDKAKSLLASAKEAVAGQSATEDFVGPPKPGLIQNLSSRYKDQGLVGGLLSKLSKPGAIAAAASSAAQAMNPEAYQGPMTREQMEAAREAERVEAEKAAAQIGPQLPTKSESLLTKLKNLTKPEQRANAIASIKDSLGAKYQKAKEATTATATPEPEAAANSAPELMGPATPSTLEQLKAQVRTKAREVQEKTGNKVKNAVEAGKGKGLKGILSSGFKAAKGKLGGVLSMASGLLSGGSDNSQEQEPATAVDGSDGKTDQQKEAEARAAAEPKVVRSKRGMVAQGSRAAGDSDGDGVKDGSVEEARNKVEELKASRDKGMLEADTSSKYKSSENVIDTMAKKLGGLLDGIKSGLGGIFNVAGMLLGGGGKIAGGIMKSFGILGRGAAALGSLTGGGGAGFATAARGVWTAAKVYGAASAASTMMAGSALAGFGSLAMTAATAVGGTLLTALSSSVVAVPLAIAGTAWLLYKAYKYAVRDNASEIESLRLQQYGFNYNTAVARYNHHVYVLEAYLQDGRVGYSSRGEPYLLTKRIDTKELLSTFEIDEKDDEAVKNFTAWFENRFKPVFFAHVGAMLTVDKQKKLSDVNSLDGSQKLRYLEIVRFPNAPYGYDVSPLGEKLELKTDGEDIVRQYDNLILKVKAEVDKKATETKKILKPEEKTGNDAKLDGGDQDKKDAQQKILDAKKALSANQGSDRSNLLENSDGDGKVPTPDSGGSSKQPAVGKVNMAPGTMKDGAEGMQFIKLNKGAKLEGLSPSMLKLFMGMAEEYGKATGKSIPVSDGVRTSAEQAALYAANPQKAAKPGRSLHEFGLALDIDSKTADELDSLGLMKKYGFTRPVGGEKWHVEPAGIQTSLDLAKSNANQREQMVAASAGRGGGGFGSEQGSPLGKRNHALAMKLLNVPATPVASMNKSEESVAAMKPSEVAANDDSMIPTTAKDAVSSGNLPSPTTSSKSRNLPPVVEKTTVAASAPSTSDASTEESEGRPTPAANLKKGGEVVSVIDEAAKRAGVDADKLKAFAAVESGMNPGARNPNSSASGLMQFMPKTFQGLVQQHGSKYGLDSTASPMDPMAASLMGAEYMKANMKTLGQVKPNPSLTDVYFAHLLGPSGAKNFFSTDPNAPASEALPKAAAQNKDLFYEDGKSLTIDGVYRKVQGRIQSKVKAFGITADVGGPGLKAPTASNTGEPGLKQKGAGVDVKLPSANSGAIAPKDAPKPTAAPASVSSATARGFSFDSTSAGYVPQSNQTGQRVDGNPNVKLESLLEKSNDTASASLKALEKIAASLSEENMAKVLKAVVSSLPKAEATKEEVVKEKDREAMGRTSTAKGSSLDLNRRTAA
jgi:hypothetical protein